MRPKATLGDLRRLWATLGYFRSQSRPTKDSSDSRSGSISLVLFV